MISPRYFGCSSYSDMIDKLKDGQALWCEPFDITLQTVGGENLTVYTSFRKFFGMVTEVTFENLFSVTEDSVQVAIMTGLAFQEEKGYFKGFKLVCESQGGSVPLTPDTLQEAVQKLAEARSAEPGEDIYIEPTLKDSCLVRCITGKIFGSNP